MPRTIDDSEFDPLTDDVQNRVNDQPWVKESRLRLRHEGRFLTGTVYVVPHEGQHDPRRIESAERELLNLGWRIHDVSIMPRSNLEEFPTGRDGAPALRAGAVRRQRTNSPRCHFVGARKSRAPLCSPGEGRR